MTLLGWWMVIFIFLKIIGVITWNWGITLFPLWVAVAIGILKTLLRKIGR